MARTFVKKLRKKGTGQIFPYSEILAQRPDMEVLEEECLVGGAGSGNKSASGLSMLIDKKKLEETVAKELEGTIVEELKGGASASDGIPPWYKRFDLPKLPPLRPMPEKERAWHKRLLTWILKAFED